MIKDEFYKKLFDHWSIKNTDGYTDKLDAPLEKLTHGQISELWDKIITKCRTRPSVSALVGFFNESKASQGDSKWCVDRERERIVDGATMDLRDVYMKKYKLSEIEDSELQFCMDCACYELLRKQIEPQFKTRQIYDGFMLDRRPQVSIDEIIELAEKNLPLWRKFKKNIKGFGGHLKQTKAPEYKIATKKPTEEGLKLSNEKCKEALNRRL